ncbi:hypothetical protein GBAR_LOCUS8800 [Geodia barretti]|uniref:Uncharacterized protein n=1 Tax=Geodia barretti TaxID=519541 RepID=A0AA35WH08_GEOBA|nr:hypothetical protein GBAR_LOCUS8800 [Geodia barretti]
MFQREAAPLQDNVDPITELLSQLSGTGSGSGGAGGGGGSGGGGSGGSGVGSMSQGAGGGAGGRRLFSDMPAHVQHLLEERQHFERVSPSRRTVYRKIVSGMQGSANPSMAYHLSGHNPVLPPHPLLDMGVGLDLSRGQASGNATRDSHKERAPTSASKANHLLASYSLPPLTEAEKSSLEQTRADKSLFVQELLLSMLASSSSSSSDSGSDSEDGT